MKKLTAGIFATLLAVVSADSAYAAIASKGYVDDQVGEVQTAVTAQIATKADSSTVTALDGRVDAAEGEIDALQTEVEGKQDALGFTPENSANKTTTLSGTSTDTQYPSAKAVWDTIQTETSDIASSGDLSALTTRVTTAEGEIDTLQADMADKANTSDLGDLATLDAVGSAQITDGSVATADIASKAVTKEKLADDIVTSLGKADSALQKTTADAAYAVKALEGQVGTVSAANMGTTATTVVTAIKEVAGEAAAAQSTATGAQNAVDAVESTIAGYGDIVSHNASEFATSAQGAKADTAVQPDDITNVERTTNKTTTLSAESTDAQYPSAKAVYDTIQAETSDIASSGDLSALTTRVTTAEGDIDDLEAAVNDEASGLAATNAIADNALSTARSAQTTASAALPKATYDSQVGVVSATNMGTSASTVVTAIKEVAGEATAAASAASTADSKAVAAQATANAAIPKPDGECSDPDNKCVLTFNNSAYAWEVIERGVAE